MNKRHYEHTLPNIRGSLSNTYYRMSWQGKTKEYPLGTSGVSKVDKEASRSPRDRLSEEPTPEGYPGSSSRNKKNLPNPEL